MSVWSYLLLTEASLPLEAGSRLPRLSRKLQDSEGSSPSYASTKLCPGGETIFSGSARKLCRELQGCGLHESSSVLKTQWYSCLSVTCSYREPQRTHWPKKLAWDRTMHLLCCWCPRGLLTSFQEKSFSRGAYHCNITRSLGLL